jgi:hypothetical protein
VRLGTRMLVVVGRRTLNLIVVTLATLPVLIVMMVALGNFHPREGAVYRSTEFLSGRRFAAIVLGFLFGALLVFWMRHCRAENPASPSPGTSSESAPRWS